MALAEYRRKRDFAQTPEPTSGQAGHGPLRFVVQKHAASRLHYDFRLELDGVLISWAVPKGPSTNPVDKHLAMKVEDHPLDYRLFEGVIPKDNYGAGTVMVWDEGTYSDAEDSADPAAARKQIKAGLASGDLKFTLHGHKLKGSWVLAKMKTAEDNAWLLIKHKDKFASPKDVTKQDRSVLSKQTLDQVKQSAKPSLPTAKLDLTGAPKRTQPKTLEPMLATLAAEPFDDPDWLYEIKWDGYRIMAHIRSGKVQLLSRNQQDYTDKFAPITEELANLKLDCILDGEMVVVDRKGRSDFGALQQYQKTGRGQLRYFVFDVPYASGHDLRKLPLERRKGIAAAILEPLKLASISDHVIGRGQDFFKLAIKTNLEGVVAKQRQSSYQDGRRGRDWLKIKTHQRQEVVIGGYTEPKGSRQQIGALVMGVYDKGRLRYVGHAGGGLSDQELADIKQRLKPLERSTSPFSTDFPTNAPVHWVRPELLAEVEFAEWTADGRLRQPRFVGLRDDKAATTVKRERPAASAQTQTKATLGRGEISHPDKLFWPRERYTKGDLVSYYNQISELILPYLADRPQSMNRFPDGINGPHFYHKDLESHPNWIKTKTIHSDSNNKDLHWLIANDRRSLLFMINLGCIELNPWHSRVGSLEKPDYCLIDLDAKTNNFGDIITVARAAGELLSELGIAAYPKTSGKTGIHICMPLGAKYSYDQSKDFAQIIVNLLHERLPKLTSVERNPDKRTHKIYLDYLQNRHGQTMAAPYCVRPIPGAPVSTPLDWDEIKPGLDPKKFTIKTFDQRFQQVGDLWKPVIGVGIDMKKILAKL